MKDELLELFDQLYPSRQESVLEYVRDSLRQQRHVIKPDKVTRIPLKEIRRIGTTSNTST